MTKKRFTIEIDDENIVHILDNETDIGQYNLCKLLNGLHEENKELKKENEQLQEEKEKWKSNCSLAVSENSILWNEISILREQGAEPSEAFNDYLNKKRGDFND